MTIHAHIHAGDAYGERVAGAPFWPGWIDALFEGSLQNRSEDTGSGRRWISMETARFRFVRLLIAGTDELSSADFQETTRRGYEAMAREISRGASRHPVRFWNYIPDIHLAGQDGIDRYMTFNAGRYAACQTWFGGETGEGFEDRLPTATGVGHAGSEVVIDCLAADMPGMSIENPRQIPAYRYSERYGPRPPCFARATLLQTGSSEGNLLMIGGTASVVGQDSQHVNDLAGQIRETLRNIAGVILRAGGSNEINHQPSGKCLVEDELSALRLLNELRVFHPRADHESLISETLEAAIPGECGVEFVQAPLCRSELLVEIEGIAGLPAKIGA